MPKKDITAGEELCTFIKRSVLVNPLWSELEMNLACCGRGEGWAAFMEEVVATQLTGRLVVAGVSIADSLGGVKGVDSVGFQQRLVTIVNDTMDINLPRPSRTRFFDLITRAILVTYGKVNASDRTIIEKEAGRPPKCFLCNRNLVMVRGNRANELSAADRPLAVEDEHIWPRSYGGDSKSVNLALACHSCNQHKANFANWAMVDIQSLVLGLPNESNSSGTEAPETLRRIPGWQRFALTSYAAHMIAQRDSLTLKLAYYNLRSKALLHPTLRRPAYAADFFNLVCHVEDE